MNDFTKQNIGMSLVGTVDMSDGHQIFLSHACLSPGEGVGAAVGVAKVALADGVAFPVDGRRIVCRGDLQHAEPVDTGGGAHMVDARWSYLDDHGTILNCVLDHIAAAIANLGLLPETASTDELDRIGAAAHYLTMALNALDGE